MLKASVEKDPKEEILDVVDVEGHVLGQATRQECHSNPELLHRVVHFTLINMDERTVLLTTRALSKKHDPGKRIFLGEHLKSGETPNIGLIRAVDEELGFRPGGFMSVGENIFQYEKQSELASFYLVSYFGEEFTLDPEESDGFEWVSLDDIRNEVEGVGEMTRYWIDRINWEALSY